VAQTSSATRSTWLANGSWSVAAAGATIDDNRTAQRRNGGRDMPLHCVPIAWRRAPRFVGAR